MADNASGIKPSHYVVGKYEVIDILKTFWPTCPNLWTAGKYLFRAGRKDGVTRLSDLKKALDYLTWEIQREEEEGEQFAKNKQEEDEHTAREIMVKFPYWCLMDRYDLACLWSQGYLNHDDTVYESKYFKDLFLIVPVGDKRAGAPWVNYDGKVLYRTEMWKDRKDHDSP